MNSPTMRTGDGLLAALVCLAAIALQAGEGSDPALTGEIPPSNNTVLQQLTDRALARNASLQAARARWEAAGSRVAQARGWPDPRVTYGYYAEPVQTRVGPQEHRIGVMQPLLWFGKLRAAGDVASQEAAAALADLEAARLDVVQQVKDTAYELFFLEHSLQITRRNIELLRQLEAVAQTKLRAGGDMSPVTKAQVELGKLQDRLSSLNELREPLESRLNALLNQPEGTPLPRFAALPTSEEPLPETGVLLAWQQEASPILTALSRRAEKQAHAIRLARKQGLPDFGVGVDYIVTGPATVAGVPDSGQDAVIAMFSLNIPLWRGKYAAAVREAQSQQAAAESSLEAQGDQLAARLQMAIYQHRDAERRSNLYSATLLPQARSAFNVARQSYETGSADFLNLIDAQRVLLEFELEHQRALANREQARAGVEMLVGRSLEAGSEE